MTRTLYVGNLPWSITPEDLTSAFAQHGEVISSRIINDRETGKSRGYGFVEVSDADYEKILEIMNGGELGGRVLTVNEAKPRE